MRDWPHLAVLHALHLLLLKGCLGWIQTQGRWPQLPALLSSRHELSLICLPDMQCPLHLMSYPPCIPPMHRHSPCREILHATV